MNLWIGYWYLNPLNSVCWIALVFIRGITPLYQTLFIWNCLARQNIPVYLLHKNETRKRRHRELWHNAGQGSSTNVLPFLLCLSGHLPLRLYSLSPRHLVRPHPPVYSHLAPPTSTARDGAPLPYTSSSWRATHCRHIPVPPACPRSPTNILSCPDVWRHTLVQWRSVSSTWSHLPISLLISLAPPSSNFLHWSNDMNPNPLLLIFFVGFSCRL